MTKTSLYILPAAILALPSMLGAQTSEALSKKTKDLQAIKNMQGCYEVSFNFVETFGYSQDPNYKPSAEKHDQALEWVELVEETEDKIVLQHLLIMNRPSKGEKAKGAEGPEGKKTEDYGESKAQPKEKKASSKKRTARPSFRSPIIKHWRQDWLYQETDLYVYQGDNHWKYVKKTPAEVSGQWAQKVFQVDDSPRYEGSATWVHVDGKSYWENATDAPLPRREYTKRDDYNVMFRRNRVNITEEGWTHDQDNDKIVRQANQKDLLLAQEKGFNTYTRVNKERCAVAQAWWKEHQTKWQLVRQEWDGLFAQKQDLRLAEKVENKPLHEHLFPVEPTANKETLGGIIQRFVRK